MNKRKKKKEEKGKKVQQLMDDDDSSPGDHLFSQKIQWQVWGLSFPLLLFHSPGWRFEIWVRTKGAIIKWVVQEVGHHHDYYHIQPLFPRLSFSIVLPQKSVDEKYP